MRRISLGGPDLAGFTSPGHADHVKLFVPNPGEVLPMPQLTPEGLAFPDDKRPSMRDYTPRYHDVEAGRLDIDFVLHGDGPASGWAASAAIGSTVGIGGPRGSFVVGSGYDYYLLMGDETALPAIGRRIEELPETSRIIARIEVADAAEEQAFAGRPNLDLKYLHRNGTAPGRTTLLLDAVGSLDLRGTGYHFIAAEAGTARAVRQSLVDRGIDGDLIRAPAYWHLDGTDGH